VHPSPVLHWLFGAPMQFANPVHAPQFALHLLLLHSVVPSGHGGFMLQLNVQLFVHVSVLIWFPSSHASPVFGSPFGHVGVGMQSGSTSKHNTVHVPSFCVLQHTLFAPLCLHVRFASHPSRAPVQSAHVHASLVSHVLSLSHVLIVFWHPMQLIAHVPSLHLCVLSGHVVVVRLQLYEQLFRHVSVLIWFPSSHCSP
jgi:hypothetical protein